MIVHIILIVIIAVCILLSAVFSAGEIASAKCSRLRFEHAAQEGDRTAKRVTSLNRNYVRTLSTILAGNNFVNIAASSAAALLFVDLLGSRGEGVASVVITVLLLFLGETCPKILAAGAPDRFVRLLALPLRISMILLFPIVWLVEKFVGLLAPLWTPKETGPQVTPEELCEILDDIEEEGVFTEQESDLIRSAIEFTETSAYEILTPRVDVVAIDLDEFSLETDLTEDFLHHSRVIVCQGSKDNVVGVLPTRALLREVCAGQTEIDLPSLLIQPIFVHKTCPISTIIEAFRRDHVQMAVVIDEYGGMMGIVTLEDILEEIVGDIYDETDQPETEFEQRSASTFTVDGGMNIYDMFDELDYEPAPDFETEYATVGGWCAELLGRLPEAGDELTFDRLHLRILNVEDMRVDKLLVELLPESEEEE